MFMTILACLLTKTAGTTTLHDFTIKDKLKREDSITNIPDLTQIIIFYIFSGFTRLIYSESREYILFLFFSNIPNIS